MVILPVSVDTTIVAAVRMPGRTVREDAITVTEDARAADWGLACGDEGAGERHAILEDMMAKSIRNKGLMKLVLENRRSHNHKVAVENCSIHT